MSSTRPTPRGSPPERAGCRLRPPGKDPEAHLDGADEEHYARRRDGREGRGPELGPAFVGEHHQARGQGGAQHPERQGRQRCHEDGKFNRGVKPWLELTLVSTELAERD